MAKRHALIAAAACLAGPATAEEGHFPVWISPSVGAATPAEAAAMLTRRFPIDPDTPFELEARPYDGSKVRAVWNCVELEQAFRDGYGYTRSSRVFVHIEADCRVLHYVAQGQPARRSTLRDFHLDRAAPRFLPAAFADTTSCDASELFVHANRRRIPWAEIGRRLGALANEIFFDGQDTSETVPLVPIVVMIEEEGLERTFLRFDQLIITPENPQLASARYNTVAGALLPMGPDRMRVYSHLYKRILEIVARGDFNGDGIDDIVIWLDGADTTGHVAPPPDAYLLTRETADAVLFLENAPLQLLAMFCETGYQRVTGEPSPYRSSEQP